MRGRVLCGEPCSGLHTRLYSATFSRAMGLLAVIVPIMYTATVMPFEVFFITDSSTVWLAIEIALTVAFGIDMLLCFNLAYQDRHGHIISSR